MSRLSGRAAIVTGGAKGIGRHYAEALAAEGAQVMIADIADGEALAREIVARHGQGAAESFVFDVSKEDEVKALVEAHARALRQDRRLGEQRRGLRQSRAGAAHRYRSRAMGQGDGGQCPRAVPDGQARGPAHAAKRYGKIVNIGSGTAYKGMANFLHYVSSKGAIVAMTRSLSREFGADGICVNTLSPGFILSDSVIASKAHDEATIKAVVQSRAFKRDAFPRTCSARSSFSRRRRATSSPARPLPLTVVR